MNYKKLLDLYISKDEVHAEWMRKPFYVSETDSVWATDGAAAIILPAELAGKDYDEIIVKLPQLPKQKSLNSCQQIFLEQLKEAVSRCGKDEIMEEVEVECPECNGEGTVLWEYNPTSNREFYEKEFECPVCDGEGSIWKEKPSGRFEPSRKFGIRIGDGIYSAWQIDRITKAMELLDTETLNVISEPRPSNSVLFQIGNRNAIVMQMPMYIDKDDKDVINL